MQKQKIHVKPGRMASIVGIFVGFVFFIFGVVFFFVLLQEDSTVGMFFMIFWLIVVAVIIFFNFYNLIKRKGVIEIETEGPPAADGSGPDFESKLRKLESLKKDGLISEAEFHKKRNEILAQKW